MANFDERLQELRQRNTNKSDDFQTRLQNLRSGKQQPIVSRAKSGPSILGRVGEFGLDIVRPVFKSLAAVTIIAAQPFVDEDLTTADVRLPIIGDVTPGKTVGEAIGTSLQTGLLAIGGGVAKGGGKLLSLAGKELLVGGGFGLGVGLEEGGEGKELVVPTLLGGALGFAAPIAIKGTGKLVKPLGSLFNRIKVPIKKTLTQLADTAPVKFITSVGERLKRFGEPGENLLKGFKNIDKETQLRAGAAMENLDSVGFNRLTKAESTGLLDAWEGRINAKVLPNRLKGVFDVFDNIRNEIATEAEKVGLKIRVKKGLELPFKGRKNFFPHFIPDPKNLKKGVLRKEIVENAVRLNKFDDVADANKVLNSYLEFAEKEGRGGNFWVEWLVKSGQAKTKTEARGMALRLFKTSRLKKFGNLEKAREIDFPFYDPDAKRSVTKYILGSFDRLETVKEFGVKAEKLNNLLGKIERLKGRDAGKEASLIIKNITNAIEHSPKAEQLSLALRALQIPKLAFAQIINTGQPIVNGVLKADIPSVAFGLSRAFKSIAPKKIGKFKLPSSFQEGKKFALKSGATLDSAIKQTIQNAAGSETSFASKFLKLTGFTATERFNRIVSANTGMRYLERTLAKLKKRPTNKVLRARVEELGLNPDDLLKNVTQKDLLTAGQEFTNFTQFRGRPIDLPLFSNSPAGKVFWQFKTFAFSQSKLIKDTIKRDLQNHNYTGVMKTLLVLGTIFPMTGEVLADVRSLVTRKDRPTEFLDRYVDDIMSAGGFGIIPDLWNSAEFGSLAESLAGPTVSTGIKGAELAVQDINSGKVNKRTIKFLMDQFGVLRPLKNEVFPAKN